MLNLATRTDPAWAQRAAQDIDVILLDHAHCEKKAASSAMGLIFRYPEQVQMMAPLSRLAREELSHFEEVLRHLERRGVPFGRLPPSGYAAALLVGCRTSEPHKLRDTLLCCALIEARSCERMALLAQVLGEVDHGPRRSALRDHEPRRSALRDPALQALYQGLLQSEARHHSLYVEMAVATYPGPEAEVRARLRELAQREAEVLAAAPREPRMHSQ